VAIAVSTAGGEEENEIKGCNTKGWEYNYAEKYVQ
jgi:hypothetical protein